MSHFLFMANTRIFLDTRRVKPGVASMLKIAISHKTKTAYVSTGCRLFEDQWDDEHSMVVNHPQSQIHNLSILGLKNQVDGFLLRLTYENRLREMSASDIKQEFEAMSNPEKGEKIRAKNLFEARFIKFMNTKSSGTKRLYEVTYKRIKEFAERKNFRMPTLTFEDINKDWLTQFDLFLSEFAPSVNARNIHFRNIRAVFNDAIDDEITTAYPFRRFKIRNVATRKRNLKVEDLRTLFNYPVEKCNKGYLDIFKLMFMLIGINTVDLANLKEIKDGRVDFYRAKTHRLYSIKVEPEALEIIERNKGKDWLVDILDRYKDHKDYTKHINMALKKIGPVTRSGLGGKKTFNPLFPEISTYWARHSWATIAASLDIPKDVIAHALGHGNNTVTDIYIDFDQNKVDEANRRVLDWVLYGKK